MTNAATSRVSPCAVPTHPPLKAFLLRDLGGIDRALKSHYPLRPNFLASDHPLIDFGWDARARSLSLSHSSHLSPLLHLTLSVMTSRDGTKNSSQTRARA